MSAVIGTVWETGFAGGWLVVSLGVPVLAMAVNIWALVDVTQKPDWAFRQAGTDKNLWLTLSIVSLVVSLLCCACFGLGAVVLAIPAIVYLAAFRSKVAAAQESGPMAFAGWAPYPGPQAWGPPGPDGPPPGPYGPYGPPAGPYGPPPAGPYGPPGPYGAPAGYDPYGPPAGHDPYGPPAGDPYGPPGAAPAPHPGWDPPGGPPGPTPPPGG